MAKLFMALTGVSGFLAVGFGAFGAHGLRNKLSAEMLSAFQTGVQYQFYHTLALLMVTLLLLRFPVDRYLLGTAVAFVVGIVLFSGSLYGLALGGPRWLGPVTPLGGLSFMVGWVMLLLASFRLTET
jgi:uncharacterized membrane protein YgdD (TMEM256/DUF423 family)